MRIESLALTNFRSHAQTTINFATLTVIRGHNAAGKSSVEQAIELALTGRAEGTDARGAGAKDFVRFGEKKATIALTLNPTTEGSPTRVLTCAVTKDGRNATVQVPGNKEWDGGPRTLQMLADNREVISCLVNNRHFVDLSDKEQKDVLASIILPTEYEWPQERIDQVKELKIAVDWNQPPYELCQTIHDTAYALRRDYNRDLKNLVIPEGDTSLAESADELSEKLTTRVQERDAAIKERADKLFAYEEASKDIKRLQDAIASSQRRIEQDSQTVTAEDVNLLSDAKLKAAKKSAEAYDKAKELDTQIIAAGLETERLKGLRDAAKKMKEGTCPTCSQAITQEVIAKIYGEYMQAFEDKNFEHSTLLDQRKKLGDPEAARRDLEAHQSAESRIKAAKGRIQDEERSKQEYQSKLDALPTTMPDVSELDAKIQDLTERIQRGTEAVGSAKAQKALREQQESARERHNELLKQVNLAEKVLAYFGTGENSIIATLLQQNVAQFTEAMGEVLREWGYTCFLSLEPYRFEVAKLNSGAARRTSLNMLSKSERYRFSVAFQVALASWSGLRFIVVDEADIFDTGGRAGLFNALLDNPNLDQVIILSTDERTGVPSLGEDVAFYMAKTIPQAGSGEPETRIDRLLPPTE